MNIQEQPFEVKRAGLTIRGIEYRPEGEKLPIAIVSHGFLQNYKSTRHYAKQFAQWGYAAYCYDFIGGGIICHSDGKLQDMSVLTEMQDLRAVIDYACGLSYTNGNSLTLIGCSQGGFVSAMVAAELGDAVRNLILFYPALCIPDDARKGKMMVFRFDPANIPDQLKFGPLTLGGDYARAVSNMDPYEKIRGYHGPVLILHGTKDAIVNLSYSRKAKDTYGENCTLQILDKAGHGFTKKEDQQAFTAIREFLKLDGAFSPHIFHKEVRPGIFRLSETASGYSDEPGAATRNSYLVVSSSASRNFTEPIRPLPRLRICHFTSRIFS